MFYKMCSGDSLIWGEVPKSHISWLISGSAAGQEGLCVFTEIENSSFVNIGILFSCIERSYRDERTPDVTEHSY